MGRAVLRRGGCGLINVYITIILVVFGITNAPEPDWRTFEATAYTADCRGCSGFTYSGIDVRQTQFNEDGRRIIATDPDVIAQGTVVEIRLADGSTYEAVAEDRGGDIKGARVDVLMATEKEALAFGKQDVQIRILNEEELRMKNVNVTVIKDEALGGLLREYSEVKRKAAVGERIKIVATVQNVDVGTIALCTRNDEFRDGSIDTDLRFPGAETCGFIDATLTQYVVLEPTDIVRIGNVRYRMVERKASVGERVVIVSLMNGVKAEIGEVLPITRSGGSVDLSFVYSDRPSTCMNVSNYRVLEPLTESPAAEDADLLVLSRHINELSAKLDAQETQINGLTDAVGKLTLQLRVAREDIVLIEEGVSAGIERLERHGGVGQYKPQLTRDDVVAKAKRDVAELLKRAMRTMDMPATEENGHLTFEFVINRDKRTVVAIGKLRYVPGEVAVHGIAKCAPGDVFNSHIGRALALRRALGLDVPAEYTKAPQPIEVRVGDVITFPMDDSDGWYGKVTYKVNSLDGGDRANLTILSSAVDGSADVGGSAFGGDLRKGLGHLVFYDDSREEVAE
ncbi:3D domain-containing protein [Paenibacillus sp. YIM B09110]|uniref:3D domain-containing protein n=1 Tax=Paenibacillus sp. YIM B09110 TaxID=3126102 RepID=UPI00301D51B5